MPLDDVAEVRVRESIAAEGFEALDVFVPFTEVPKGHALLADQVVRVLDAERLAQHPDVLRLGLVVHAQVPKALVTATGELDVDVYRGNPVVLFADEDLADDPKFSFTVITHGPLLSAKGYGGTAA